MMHKKIKLTAVVFSALIILSGTTFVLSQSAGPDGSFGYSVPIDVPPGVNGVQPKLSLEYNSNSGNGIAGVGWSMEGIPSISRDTTHPISYNGTDHYVVSDAGRLSNVSGKIYHTEIENFSKFEAVGTSGDGPLYWIEYKPDGSKLYYGTVDSSDNATCETSSRQFNGHNCVYKWSLSKAEDANGNYYTVEYFQDSGEIYPSRILYTIQKTPGIFSSYCDADFSYEDRTDYGPDYTYGTLIQTKKRLQKITLQTAVPAICGYPIDLLGKVKNIYTVSYTAGNGIPAQSTASMITVTEAGGNKVDSFSMTWNAASTSDWSSDQYPTAAWGGTTNDDNRWIYSDFNGDGKTDIGFVANSKPTTVFYVTGSTGSGWNEDLIPDFSADWSGKDGWCYRWRTGDFNGDGLQDVIFVGGGDALKIKQNMGTGWSDERWLSPEISDASLYQYVDINGDGIDDIVYFEPHTYDITRNYGDGDTSTTTYTTGVTLHFYRGDTFEELTAFDLDTTLDDCVSRFRFADFDGDGKCDIAFIDATNSKIATWLNRGTSWVSGPSDTPIPYNGTDRWFFADVNGDGKADEIFLDGNRAANHQVLFSDGAENGTFISGPYLKQFGDGKFPARFHYCDMNGDGKADVLYIHRNSDNTRTLNVMLSTGNDWVATDSKDFFSANDNNEWRLNLGDLNGDGMLDVIGTGGEEPVHNNYGVLFLKESKNRVMSIQRQIGSKVSVDYTLSTTLPDVNLPVYGSYPRISNKSIRYLVTGISTSDGRDHTYKTSYYYSKGKIFQGVPFITKDLGFEYITQKNEQTGEAQTTYYEQSDYYSGGNPIRIETSDGSDQQTSIKKITYSSDDTDFGTTSVQTVKETTDVYEAGSPRFQTSVVYAYDDSGNMTQSTSYDGVNTIKTTVAYDVDRTNWLLSRPKESKITSGSKILSWQTITYDGMNPFAKNVWSSEENKWITSSFTYTAEGRVHTITDALGNVTTLTYSGNTTTITDPLGHVSYKETDPATGKVIKETDTNGHVITTAYDSQGRATQIEDGSDVMKKVLYINEGDPNNQYVETREYSSSEKYVFSQSYYDGLGREYKQISLQQSADGGSSLYQITEKTYNSKGQLETQTGPYISADTAGTNADNKYTTTYTYDDSNRVIGVTKQTAAGDVTVSTIIDPVGANLQVTSKDPKGNKNISLYDPRGKLVRKTEPEGGIISYNYDESGRLTATTVNGLVTTIVYDTLGRRKSISDPDKGLTSYTYDDLGRVQTMTDAKNQTTTYSYDAAGRLTKEDNPDGTRDVNYLYDTSACGINRLAQVSDGEVTTTYAYDIRGNVTSTNQIIDGYNFRFGMEYDMQNRVTKLTYPHGKDIRNLYSDTGSLAAVYSITNGTIGAYARYGIATADSYVSSSTAESDITKITSSSVTIEAIRQHQILRHTADGINTVIGYDPSTQRPTSLQSFYGNDSDKKWEDISYDYDKNGNIITINDTVKPAQNQTFAYDGINRLTSAQGVYGTEGYTYYTNGNLKTKGTKTLNYNNSHAHAVSSVDGGNTYTYDTVGNMITRGTDTLSYDAKNRMVSITNSTKTENYVYDHSGQRVKKTRKDGTVIYSIGGLYELTIVPNNTPAHTMYIYGLKGDLIAQKTTADKTLMDNLAANSYLDGMNTNNTLKRWFYTIAYAFVKDRGLSRDIQKIAPWVFVGFGGLLLAFGMFNRFRYRGKQPIFKRLCADLVPLVLCVFISGTGLSACGSPTIADDTDDPIYTDAKATASPSPAAPAGTASTASASVTAAASANSTAASAASAASTQSVVTSTASTAASASASTGTTLSNGGTGLDSGGVSASSTDVTGIPIIGIFYFHPDHLGSVKYMTHPEASGTEPKEVWRTAYTPYGETVATQTSGSKTLHKTYTGQTDDINDLMYYNARYYDPGIGRFITADDVVPDAMSSLSYDRYMYVDGNPVTHRDPSGHSKLGSFISSCVSAVVGGCKTAAGKVGHSLKKAASTTGKVLSSKRFWRGVGYGVAGMILGSMMGPFGSFVGGTNGFLAGYNDIYSHDSIGFTAFMSDSTWSLPNTAMGLGFMAYLEMRGQGSLNQKYSKHSNAYIYTGVGDSINSPGLTLGNTFAVQMNEGDPEFKMTMRHELTHVWQYRIGSIFTSLKLAQEQICGPYGLNLYDPYYSNWNLEHNAQNNGNRNNNDRPWFLEGDGNDKFY